LCSQSSAAFFVPPFLFSSEKIKSCFIPYAIMATITGPQAVSRMLPIAQGMAFPRAGSLLCASSWTVRSAAVTVPPPLQAPRRIPRFIFKIYQPKRTGCGAAQLPQSPVPVNADFRSRSGLSLSS
jgi:hypothetical protein